MKSVSKFSKGTTSPVRCACVNRIMLKIGAFYAAFHGRFKFSKLHSFVVINSQEKDTVSVSYINSHLSILQRAMNGFENLRVPLAMYYL